MKFAFVDSLSKANETYSKLADVSNSFRLYVWLNGPETFHGTWTNQWYVDQQPSDDEYSFVLQRMCHNFDALGQTKSMKIKFTTIGYRSDQNANYTRMFQSLRGHFDAAFELGNHPLCLVMAKDLTLKPDVYSKQQEIRRIFGARIIQFKPDMNLPQTAYTLENSQDLVHVAAVPIAMKVDVKSICGASYSTANPW